MITLNVKPGQPNPAGTRGKRRAIRRANNAKAEEPIEVVYHYPDKLISVIHQSGSRVQKTVLK